MEEHKKNRDKVCIACYRKGSPLLSKNDISCVQKFIIRGYYVENLNIPSALCNGCFLLLNKKKSNGHDVNLPTVDSYDPERPTNLLRSTTV